MKHIVRILALLVTFLFVAYSQAKTVSISITPKLTADAEYLVGEKDKPVLFILHGFLATRAFQTIQTMVSGLNVEGYTVLAPNLTLNISQRHHSLKCQAIHTHTLEKDIVEIQKWVQWLKQQGHKRIIVIGHSNGSLGLLTAEHEGLIPEVDMAIYTSLFYLNGKGLGIDQNDLKKAHQLYKANKNVPNAYSFLFCKNNYNATPESYLSYQKVSRPFVLDALKSTEKPTYIIMGGQDKRYNSVGHDWLDKLRETKAKLVLIDDANHFFSGESEFELLDQITQIIEENP